MYKERMDGQTILFKTDYYCKAYHLKYFNEHYNIINRYLAGVREIYYKCNDSRGSWINYRTAMLSGVNLNCTDKIMNAKKLTSEELVLLPECEYTDAYGFKYSIGARDGLDSPSALKPKITLKPRNFDLVLNYDYVNGQRKYRLHVNFKADISNSIIIFNGLYYPYHLNSDKISVTYYEEDGVDFPKIVDAYDNYMENEDGSFKVFDPKENREYYSVIPYAWSNVVKEKEFYAKCMNGDWIEFPEEIDGGCLLFYNSVMYFYEINNLNDRLVKITSIDSGNVAKFDVSNIKIVKFVNKDENQGQLKQQKMVGLFQVDKKNASVYFPSSVSDGIITYNGINETYLINPDNKSLRFMMPHEVYGMNHNLFKTICEGSVINCINFYTGDIDGNIYSMPHDELTNIANNLINKYKNEAETTKRELNSLQEKVKLIYPNYKDTITSYKIGFFEGDERPYFELKYRPILDSVKLFINGVAYKSDTYFYYHLLDGNKPIVVWDYLAMNNGFDIKDDFDITVVYDILYSDNENFNPTLTNN